MTDREAKTRELQSKIDHNKVVRDRAIHLRSLLKDQNSISQCDTQIKESQKYIDYFSEELHKLHTRSLRSSAHGSDDLSFEGAALSFATPDSGRNSPTQSPAFVISPRISSTGIAKKYTNLDLLTSAVPYNKPKVSLKLHELEYKLDVEKKVLAGIKTLADVLGRDYSVGDKRRRDEVQGQMQESIEKRNLLDRALRKYKGLYIGEGDEDDYELETPPSARVPPGFRRPVTGNLQLQIVEARELAHAPTRMIRAPDTIVVVKIDGNIEHQSRPSRNARWNDECKIHVNKASEVEIAIYDQGIERKLPIGILWLKITDIAEGLRKRKIQQEGGQGWVSAEVAQQRSRDMLHNNNPHSPIPQQPATVPATEEGIEAWFDVEPLGEIALRLNFVRESANRRPLDKLGRMGAVRQRPGEVHEMNGHQFVEKKFYNVMKCSLCGEFLVNSGYQCEDCDLTCHKKCYGRVVTKCISRSSSEEDVDEEKLNHHIPHRFVPITNIGANWCCHCGYMLPLGSRGAKKCSECDITCHRRCQHFVPDFCGLSMEMANQMLAEIKAAKRKTLDAAPTASSSSLLKPRPPRLEDGIEHQLILPDTLASQMSQMSVQPQPHSTSHLPSPSAGQQHIPQMSTPDAHSDLDAEQQHSARYSVDLRYQEMHDQYNATNVRPCMQNQQQSSPYAPIPNPAILGRPQHNQPPAPGQEPLSPVDVLPKPLPIKSPNTPTNIGLDDFNFLAVLGRGNFGKVMLAEEKHDRNLYAIKVLKKRFIIDNDELESVRSEKRIFQAANRERHPFLTGLHSCFQTESRVYFVMEYVSGGDLMWHIQREPFSERRAKFYACEVLLALEYFHKQGITYRDLKLDNILLGLDGHVKIADYGLCKEEMWYGCTTGTFCGTPEFMAPEILLEQKYGREVDWWAYGVLIYEMLLGQSPFRGEDEDEIFDAILEDEILYPINMSRDSVSICQKLLMRNPTMRLGAGKDDAQEIKQHAFFRGVNWDDMLAKRVPPPFYPTITGRLDTSNFDEEFTRERPALTPIQSNLTRMEQQEFDSFPYISGWVLQGITKRSDL
ncbi:kinase-like domain-containing protein [Dichotomocladium elegans]|nr:kinase-like domain-containing protein [Dichotomocladium elegans]